MVDLNKYQKEVKLRDGTKVLIRPMVAGDKDALYEFFKQVPREEVRYLRDDVGSREIVENWAAKLDYAKTLPIVALKDDSPIAHVHIQLSGQDMCRGGHLAEATVFSTAEVVIGELDRQLRRRADSYTGLNELID